MGPVTFELHETHGLEEIEVDQSSTRLTIWICCRFISFMGSNVNGDRKIEVSNRLWKVETIKERKKERKMEALSSLKSRLLKKATSSFNISITENHSIWLIRKK